MADKLGDVLRKIVGRLAFTEEDEKLALLASIDDVTATKAEKAAARDADADADEAADADADEAARPAARKAAATRTRKAAATRKVAEAKAGK